MPSATMYRPLSSMIEKLSSLCVRFMPTFVSPATSMRSSPPTTWDRRKDARTVSTASLRCRTKHHGELAKFVAAEHEELHRIARGVLAHDVGELLPRIHGLAIHGNDHVGRGLQACLFGRARRRDGNDPNALDDPGPVGPGGLAADAQPRGSRRRCGGCAREKRPDGRDGRRLPRGWAS